MLARSPTARSRVRHRSHHLRRGTVRRGRGCERAHRRLPGESTALAENCVRAVLERCVPDRDLHARVITRSAIPVSRGLKSSSAAANAIIFATLDALGQEVDEIEAIRLGTKAAMAAGVSLTGAFDDACAAWFGGVVLTDNRSETILARDIMPDHLKVLIHVPDFQIRKGALPRERIAAMRDLVIWPSSRPREAIITAPLLSMVCVTPLPWGGSRGCA